MGCSVSSKDQKINLVIDSVPNKSFQKSFPLSTVVSNPRRFSEMYKVGKCLGAGSLGEIREAVHRETRERRLIKIFYKHGEDMDQYSRFMSEITILQRLDHPNIIKLLEFVEDDKRVYLILEHCNGGEIFEELHQKKAMNEKNAALICKQLLATVEYLHDKNIVHRDIRPENMLLEKCGQYFHVKFIDFSAAIEFDESGRLEDVVGSSFYLAPEVFSNNYQELCDEWSCGVILYILLSGNPPFPGNTNEEIMERVQTFKYSLEDTLWDNVSSDGKELLQRLLSPVENRISAKEALKHPWLSAYGTYNIPEKGLLDKAMNNLMRFNYINRFRDAISLFISTQISAKQEFDDLRQLFRKLDTNLDGKLSVDEIKEGLVYISNVVSPDEYIRNLMKEADTDRNGFIDYNEFLRATLDERELSSKQNLRWAFENFDLDKNGKISSAEMQQIFCLGDIDADMWDEVVDEASHNKDGEIGFEEFCNFMIDLANK